MARRQKVHGLYVSVPLRDYHIAYILAGLKLLREKHVKQGNKAQVKYIDNLSSYIRKYFSELIKKTKDYRKYLDHKPLDPKPPISVKPIPKIEVFLDPDYKIP